MTDNLPPLEPLLQEQQAWLERYQATQRADLHRMRAELAVLEEKRSDLMARVSADNADEGSRLDLEQAEERIEDLKLQITVLQRESRDTLMKKRQEMADTVNGRIESLQAEVTGMRNEKERLRTEDLPAVERRVEEMKDRVATLDATILQISEEISRLNRHSITTEDLELD